MTAQPVKPHRPVEPAEVFYSRILDAVGRDIINGTLPQGSRLTLDDLQQQFGVSRTVVRDCMRILESMNLVLPKRRVGIVVQARERWNVYDARVIRWRLSGPGRVDQFRSLTQLRCAVEPAAALAAAGNATPGERARVVELAAQLRSLGESGELDEFLEVDIEFHALVLKASGNEMFSALTEVVAEVLSGRTRHGLMPHNPREHALARHEEVAAAISKGDARAAELCMTSLLAEVRQAIP